MRYRTASLIVVSIILGCMLTASSIAIGAEARPTLKRRTVTVPSARESATPLTRDNTNGLIELKSPSSTPNLEAVPLKCAPGFVLSTDTSQCPGSENVDYKWACIDKREMVEIECPDIVINQGTPWTPFAQKFESIPQSEFIGFWDYSPGFAMCVYERSNSLTPSSFSNMTCPTNAPAKRYLGETYAQCEKSYPMLPNPEIVGDLSTLCNANSGFTCGYHSREVKACMGSSTGEVTTYTSYPGGQAGDYIHCCK